MSHEFLADRRKALEDAFFAKQDTKLVARLRQERERSLAIAALKGASSIDDPDLLGRLVDLGIDARSWTALALVPLVEVAWADGRVEPKERDAILAMARQHGVAPGSPGDALLESLLAQRPEAAVFAAWGGYVTELAAHLTAGERDTMRARLVERARKVARAAGGLLGIASISDAEKRVIAALEKPFA
jgi:uncharacterized tellurite resistance protein B-like protein